ncbi:MAG: protein kinase [Kofleriaceae bacterium]|nr:protein kinase [Kofleriaceae bacterium]
MTQPTNAELERYITGGYEGNTEQLERYIASDPQATAYIAEQAQLEIDLREFASQVSFCPGCDDVMRSERCDSCGAVASAGGFVVERVLVQSASGRMYVAHDEDGRKVALKELAFVQCPDANALASFERESEFLRALSHPAIPRFVASFREGEGVHTRFYLAQEFIEGKPLDSALCEHWFTEEEILDIADQVLDVLVYLQSLSPMVVHRDIKPANLIRRDDASLALVDFGAAYDQGQTMASTTVGTFGYMPTEQMAGIVDETSDPYSLGASLLHLLTRREPWNFKVTSDWEPVNISWGAREFLTTLLASEPGDRFENASAAKKALATIGDDLALKRNLPKRAGAKVTPQKTRWSWIAAAAALLTVGAGTGIIATLTMQKAPTYIVTGPEAGNLNSAPDTIPAEETMEELLEQAIEPPTLARPDKVLLPVGELRDWNFEKSDLHEIARSIATEGGVNIVVPDHIEATVSATLKDMSWSQVLTTILETKGLWYEYLPEANIIRIATRKDLDREYEASIERYKLHQALGRTLHTPEVGGTLSTDFTGIDIHSLMELLAQMGKVNIVVPDHIEATVTVRFKEAPWRYALEAVLTSKGLWYRYDPESRVVRIDTQKNLDHEDEAELERLRRQ